MAKKKTTKQLKKLDENGKRKNGEQRQKKTAAAASAAAPAVERRKKRRRQIDPTTCEREYSDQEIEFMHAMDEYKSASGRMFPTCSEILEVLNNIGYRKVADPIAIYDPNAGQNTETETEDAFEEFA